MWIARQQRLRERAELFAAHRIDSREEAVDGRERFLGILQAVFEGHQPRLRLLLKGNIRLVIFHAA